MTPFHIRRQLRTLLADLTSRLVGRVEKFLEAPPLRRQWEDLKFWNLSRRLKSTMVRADVLEGMMRAHELRMQEESIIVAALQAEGSPEHSEACHEEYEPYESFWVCSDDCPTVRMRKKLFP